MGIEPSTFWLMTQQLSEVEQIRFFQAHPNLQIRITFFIINQTFHVSNPFSSNEAIFQALITFYKMVNYFITFHKLSLLLCSLSFITRLKPVKKKAGAASQAELQALERMRRWDTGKKSQKPKLLVERGKKVHLTDSSCLLHSVKVIDLHTVAKLLNISEFAFSRQK